MKKIKTIRENRLFSYVGLLGLSVTLGQPAMSLEPASSCGREYPIPTTSVKYEQALASETLAPDRISINGKVANLGITEKKLTSILGSNSTVVEDWQQRTDEQQCDYLTQVLHNHPNSMHLYKLGDLKLKKMSGLFRVSEWQLPDVGTLRAFFYKPAAGLPERSYLYHLTFVPTSLEKIQRKKGPGYILIRSGAPRIEWNVQTNGISISSHSNGG